MERVVAYVDGFNLYYGLRSKGWKRFYWLNIPDLIRLFLRPGQRLVKTKYFTTIVQQPEDKRLRQAVFLDALRTLPDFSIYYGQFLSDTKVCHNCGYTYTTYHEKMTDVNIAVELMADALKDLFDVAFLVSADSDLVGPVRLIKRLFHPKRVVAIFPPDRFSSQLEQISNGILHINHVELSKSQFPEEVVTPGGVILRRPNQWH